MRKQQTDTKLLTLTDHDILIKYKYHKNCTQYNLLKWTTDNCNSRPQSCKLTEWIRNCRELSDIRNLQRLSSIMSHAIPNRIKQLTAIRCFYKPEHLDEVEYERHVSAIISYIACNMLETAFTHPINGKYLSLSIMARVPWIECLDLAIIEFLTTEVNATKSTIRWNEARFSCIKNTSWTKSSRRFKYSIFKSSQIVLKAIGEFATRIKVDDRYSPLEKYDFTVEDILRGEVFHCVRVRKGCD